VIEAELKARLVNPSAVRVALAGRAHGELSRYHDIYFDTAGAELDAEGREIRLRTMETAAGARHLLTYKEPVVDEASGSKPEHETVVITPAAVFSLLGGLGLQRLVELTKECENFRFTAGDREFLATLVHVPELEGTFLEVETMAEDDDLGAALAAVRQVLGELGVTEAELTRELYTDAVRAVRSKD
jgi:adenylate cyclase class 2